MPRHVVVDGSNLATEGRSTPSLKQLNEAVLAYMSENPDALITVVVDATFGHRIDVTEVAEFDAAVSNNEIVAPPAGAIGRGDAFVLSIANKVNATILSNDSYQEFHGTHTWLFDEGRLVGGKPVPHIGWVFVNRLPVRGPTSRKAVSEAKRGRSTKVKPASPEASQPMPVPAAPPPGATLQKPARGRDSKAAAAAKPADTAKPVDTSKSDVDSRPEPTPRSTGTNDLLAFLTFVEHHKPGSSVNAIVENYSSHGAYVRIGDVKGYVPLSLMSDPAPRSAREFMKIGESITLVVESFAPARRSIDLAIPTMTTVKMPPVDTDEETKPKRASRKAAAKAPATTAAASAEPVQTSATDEAAPAPKKRGALKASKAAPDTKPTVRTKKKSAAEGPPVVEAAPVEQPPVVESEAPKPAKKRAPRKAPPAKAAPPVEASAPVKPTRRRAKSS
jgi:S1 RNA binding domain/Zc3h12a-like Ribonuclease NYN domain